jgi:glycerol-3-phosphate dehydrogenase
MAGSRGAGEAIGSTPYVWAELAAACHEQVRHLEDLMLRRLRLGLLLPGGGRSVLERVKPLCRDLLAWDEARWDREKQAYLKTWQEFYAPLH